MSSHIHFVKILDFWVSPSFLSTVNVNIKSKRPITRYLSSEYNFLYNKNIKEGMEENKMTKQIVPLDVDYSSKKEGKSNAIILKLRKGKMEWVLYDSPDKEQLKLILELVMHHVNTVK